MLAQEGNAEGLLRRFELILLGGIVGGKYRKEASRTTSRDVRPCGGKFKRRKKDCSSVVESGLLGAAVWLFRAWASFFGHVSGNHVCELLYSARPAFTPESREETVESDETEY